MVRIPSPMRQLLFKLERKVWNTSSMDAVQSLCCSTWALNHMHQIRWYPSFRTLNGQRKCTNWHQQSSFRNYCVGVMQYARSTKSPWTHLWSMSDEIGCIWGGVGVRTMMGVSWNRRFWCILMLQGLIVSTNDMCSSWGLATLRRPGLLVPCHSAPNFDHYLVLVKSLKIGVGSNGVGRVDRLL